MKVCGVVLALLAAAWGSNSPPDKPQQSPPETHKASLGSTKRNPTPPDDQWQNDALARRFSTDPEAGKVDSKVDSKEGSDKRSRTNKQEKRWSALRPRGKRGSSKEAAKEAAKKESGPPSGQAESSPAVEIKPTGKSSGSLPSVDEDAQLPSANSDLDAATKKRALRSKKNIRRPTIPSKSGHADDGEGSASSDEDKPVAEEKPTLNASTLLKRPIGTKNPADPDTEKLQAMPMGHVQSMVAKIPSDLWSPPPEGRRAGTVSSKHKSLKKPLEHGTGFFGAINKGMADHEAQQQQPQPHNTNDPHDPRSAEKQDSAHSLHDQPEAGDGDEDDGSLEEGDEYYGAEYAQPLMHDVAYPMAMLPVMNPDGTTSFMPVAMPPPGQNHLTSRLRPVIHPDDERNGDRDELEDHILVRAFARTGKERVVAINCTRFLRIIGWAAGNAVLFFVVNFAVLDQIAGFTGDPANRTLTGNLTGGL